MFQRLFELSQILPKKEPWEYLNEGMPSNYDRGFAICFNADSQYVGVRSVQGYRDVVYRSGPSNGADFTPCSKRGAELAKTMTRLERSLGYALDADLLNASKHLWQSILIQE